MGVVIPKHRVDGHTQRPEVLRDLRPLRVVEAVNAAGIEVVADEQDRINRTLLLDPEHAGAKN